MDELIIIIVFVSLAFLMVVSFIVDREKSISADLMHTFDQTSILIDAIEEAISTNPEELNKYYHDLYELLKDDTLINGIRHLSDAQKIKYLLHKQVELYSLYKKIIREIPISKGGDLDDTKKYDAEEQHQENN